MKVLEEVLKKQKKTHIVFDFDETILELLLPWDIWFSKIQTILDRYDKTILQDYKDKKILISEAQNKAFRLGGDSARKEINKYTEEFESTKLQGVRLNNELIEFIKQNSERYSFSIWSSNSRAVIDKVLAEQSMVDYFKTIVSRDSSEFLKPDPSGFKNLHDGKTPMSNYLFVGDSSNDERAAKALGMDYLKVTF